MKRIILALALINVLISLSNIFLQARIKKQKKEIYNLQQILNSAVKIDYRDQEGNKICGPLRRINGRN